MQDFESAYDYYKKFTEIKTAYNLDIYKSENAKIGVVFSKVGLREDSEKIFEAFKNYAENDKSIYKHLSLAVYYSYQNDTRLAIEQLRLFSQQDNYHFWTIIFLKMDPLIDNIKDLPEFKNIFNEIESKFWKSHKQIRATLEAKELL